MAKAVEPCHRELVSKSMKKMERVIYASIAPERGRDIDSSYVALAHVHRLGPADMFGFRLRHRHAPFHDITPWPREEGLHRV